MAIIMDEFLPVPNIAPSSYILLRNNLSYIISIIFFCIPRPFEHVVTAIRQQSFILHNLHYNFFLDPSHLNIICILSISNMFLFLF